MCCPVVTDFQGGDALGFKERCSRRRVITPHVLAAGDIDQESRATFEKQGVSLTKMNVQMGNMDGRVQLEALHWIAEQERESTRRDNLR